MTGSKLSIFSHPWKITDYWITTRSKILSTNIGLPNGLESGIGIDFQWKKKIRKRLCIIINNK
jgi:hypothetical protein